MKMKQRYLEIESSLYLIANTFKILLQVDSELHHIQLEQISPSSQNHLTE